MIPALVLPDDAIFAAVCVLTGLAAGWCYAWFHG